MADSGNCMERLIAAFKRNSTVYASHHLHLTARQYKRDQEFKSLFRILWLPLADDAIYRQCQTSIVVSSVGDLERAIARVLACGVELVGYKLEGIITKHTPMKGPFVDFCYFELHSRHEAFTDDIPKKAFWSFSLGHGTPVSARKIYDKDFDYSGLKKVEVCYHEEWFPTDIEAKWRNCGGEMHQRALTSLMKQFSKEGLVLIEDQYWDREVFKF